MKTIAAVAVGIVIGGVGVYFGQPLLESYFYAAMSPQCGAVVRLSRSGDQIVVKPENVCLHKGRRLTWDVVTNAANDKVEIDFKKKEGPFPKVTDNPHNTRKGHYEITGQGAIDSNPAGSKGRWDYKITWTPSEGPPITLDPAVCIRGGR